MSKGNRTRAERIAAAKDAKKAAPEFRDVPVILDDGGLAKLIDALRDELMAAQQEEAADLRLAAGFPKSNALQEKLNAALLEAHEQIATLRFTELPAPQWAEVVSRSPVRLDVDMDKHYGFNSDQATLLAAPLSGAWVEGEDTFALSAEEWTDMLGYRDEAGEFQQGAISGNELRRIGDAIFELNEFAPGLRLEQAKKAFATPRG